MNARILVVDDEDMIRWALRERLSLDGYAVTEAHDGASARQAFASMRFDAALFDLKLPDATGVELMREAHQQQPDLPVMIITAYSSIEGAVNALKAGAVDYITKPFDMDELLINLGKALQHSNMERALTIDLRQKSAQFGLDNILGDSAAMRAVKAIVQRVALGSASSTVLLLGESGSGKDLVARAIHYESQRAPHPFMNITCTALPESLLESELFGHEAGAFTSAATRKKGLFELAHRGTVFLDEIGDMAPVLQAKLLRVLEEKTFRRIGGSADIEVDVRIVAATNQDLERLVEERSFREDLYYRLCTVPILLPPLRERAEDIPLLAQHFLRTYNREFRKEVDGFTPEALQRLNAHPWPGNVRELRNTIERAVLLGKGETIGRDALTLGYATTPGKTTAQPGEPIPMPPDGCTLAEAEASLVRQALARCNGNLTQAGKLLGISRDQVRYKMEKFGLDQAG